MSWNPLLGRARVEGWKARLLSFGGKLTLIKHVLCSIPIHTLAAVPIPNTFLANLERIGANFLWSANGDSRHHWLSWSKICHPMKAMKLASDLFIKPWFPSRLRWLGLFCRANLCGQCSWEQNRVLLLLQLTPPLMQLLIAGKPFNPFLMILWPIPDGYYWQR